MRLPGSALKTTLLSTAYSQQPRLADPPADRLCELAPPDVVVAVDDPDVAAALGHLLVHHVDAVDVADLAEAVAVRHVDAQHVPAVLRGLQLDAAVVRLQDLPL